MMTWDDLIASMCGLSRDLRTLIYMPFSAILVAGICAFDAIEARWSRRRLADAPPSAKSAMRHRAAVGIVLGWCLGISTFGVAVAVSIILACGRVFSRSPEYPMILFVVAMLVLATMKARWTWRKIQLPPSVNSQ